jgi:hypothetical protein
MWETFEPECRTKNYWFVIDTGFQDGAGSMSLLSLPIKVANISLMVLVQSIASNITLDAISKNVDTALMLILGRSYDLIISIFA